MQVLARAREIIADPKNWVQGEYSTDRTGAPVAPFDEDACCFCIIGAVDRAVAEHIGLQVVAHDYEGDVGAGIAALEDHELGKAAIERLQQFAPGLVSDFNDERTHSEVIALLDQALSSQVQA